MHVPFTIEQKLGFGPCTLPATLTETPGIEWSPNVVTAFIEFFWMMRVTPFDLSIHVGYCSDGSDGELVDPSGQFHISVNKNLPG